MSDRPVSLSETKRMVAAAQSEGKRVVLANGCFDLFHVGHVRYLEGARALGDVLIVGINSDAAVRKLKGKGRPVMTAADRAAIVAAVEATSAVFVFDSFDVRGLLRELRPDVHAKGTDYSVESVPERDTSMELGIEVCIVGDPKNHAAGSLIDRVRSQLQ